MVVIRVPSAVLLHEVEVEDDPAGDVDGLAGMKDGLARRVAAPGPRVDAPCSVGLAIDGVGDGPVGALLSGTIVKLRLERLFRVGEVGLGADELHVEGIGGLREGGDLDLELGEGGHAADGPPRAAGGKAGMGKLLEAEGADLAGGVRAPEMRGPLGGGVAAGDDGAVGQMLETLAVIACIAALDGQQARPASRAEASQRANCSAQSG